MRRSLILEKLKRDEYVVIVQSWIVPHWKVVDLMGVLGFDGVWIEHEHSDFSYGELSQMILAARAHDMDSLVRVARTGYTGILKLLEAGVTGIIVPHCMGAEDAKSIVRDAKYAPLGMRGAGGSVDADYGTSDRMEYFQHANRETLVAVIIEDKEAVDEVDAIAATEGIDALLLGPGDLSQSYGLIGQLDHPVIHQATDAMAEACARHGKWWGAPVESRDHAEALLRRGARLLQSGNDQAVLVSGFRQMKEMLQDLKI
jgi:2-keto-3-deoxy-L-rhamnonate aldolase RhmA